MEKIIGKESAFYVGLSDEKISELYGKITRHLIRENLTITTMESCTSGCIASFITDTEGASAVMKGAFVTYSNMAKKKSGVPSDVIQKHGVYSQETAERMAIACSDFYDANIGVGVTGTFGNVDENNADSVEQEVYVCIAVETSDTKVMFPHKFLLPYAETRHKYKLMVAAAVAYSLLEILHLQADD